MIIDTLQCIHDTNYVVNEFNISAGDTLHHTFRVINSAEQTSIMDKVLENSLTIIIALIAGLVALYQVKSNIVSSARIRWIENLRLDISELYNCSLSTMLYFNMYQTKRDMKDFDKYDSAHSKFFVLANKVRMQLNLKEEKHKELIQLLNQVEDMMDPKNIQKHDQEIVEIELKKIVSISRDIFKIEWDRSKKIFRI